MAKPDTVMIQPLTSYGEGAEVKHAHSAPYDVERPHAIELTSNGFARMLDGSAHLDLAVDEPVVPEAEDQRADIAIEGKIDNDAEPRGRRGPRS